MNETKSQWEKSKQYKFPPNAWQDTNTMNETKKAVDKRKMIYCARCGEQSGGRNTSFWASVHKWGPTTHKFKPTNKKPA